MAEMTRETELSIAASSVFPGFKFSPTDEELLSYYLKKKLEGSDRCVEVISELEINRYEPWDLPAKSVIQSENEWFFFSPRGRKYPNGSQNKRATESGYWKATGKERNVKAGSNVIGSKRTLVFHTGRAPKGERTEWIMHEYCLSGKSQVITILFDNVLYSGINRLSYFIQEVTRIHTFNGQSYDVKDSLVICRLRRNIDFRLNDTPRPSSLNERTLLIENDCKFGGANAFSKESSGHNSVEQQSESGSVSDQKQVNELSQPGSSHQVCYDDDCFAEILKDEIVDLGLLPPAVRKSEDERSLQPIQEIYSPVSHFQGTANRRIKLSKQKIQKHRANVLEVEIGKNKRVEDESSSQNTERSPKCFMRLLSGMRIGRRSLSMFLVFLTLLIFCFSMLRVPGKPKKVINMLP
ncbi:hypothetical protein RHGRI_037827 [Rhododendron griersonianum]|uniref:NAC domain-containing protein n=1 Tax=Rhododendron griersonianum TaxID=479676 RepID=A0AAV6HWK7_9ERIC|nr:hypothetical protein RHGRI_037827 [Rhododendron griersonianum]